MSAPHAPEARPRRALRRSGVRIAWPTQVVVINERDRVVPGLRPSRGVVDDGARCWRPAPAIACTHCDASVSDLPQHHRRRRARDARDASRERIPLELHEVPSGTPVLDWTVPDEWNIRDACIADARRRARRRLPRVEPPRGRLQRAGPGEMSLARARAAPALAARAARTGSRTAPRTTRETWGFCLAADRSSMRCEDGDVRGRASTARSLPGSLTYGECFLPGETEDEVLLSTHVCHPSLANDNLSGIALLTELGRARSPSAPRRLTLSLPVRARHDRLHRLAGANEERLGRIAHGLVLACVGDAGAARLQAQPARRRRRSTGPSRMCSASATAARVLDFVPWGYDERQFCSPGLRPAGRLPDALADGEFPEYHTSADDLDLVTPERSSDSLRAALEIVDVLERDRRYRNLAPEGRAAARQARPLPRDRRRRRGERAAGAALGAEPVGRDPVRCSTSPSARASRSATLVRGIAEPLGRLARRASCARMEPTGPGTLLSMKVASSRATTATSARHSRPRCATRPRRLGSRHRSTTAAATSARRDASRRARRATCATSRRRTSTAFDAVVHLAAPLERPARRPRPGLDATDQRRRHPRGSPSARRRPASAASSSLPPAAFTAPPTGARRSTRARRSRPLTPYAESKVRGGGRLLELADDGFSPVLDAERDRLRRLAAPAARHRAQQPRRVGAHDRPRSVCRATARRGARSFTCATSPRATVALLEAPAKLVTGRRSTSADDAELPGARARRDRPRAVSRSARSTFAAGRIAGPAQLPRRLRQVRVRVPRLPLRVDGGTRRRRARGGVRLRWPHVRRVPGSPVHAPEPAQGDSVPPALSMATFAGQPSRPVRRDRRSGGRPQPIGRARLVPIDELLRQRLEIACPHEVAERRPGALRSTFGAPPPSSRSSRFTVRKSMLKRVRPVVFGTVECSCAAENRIRAAGRGDDADVRRELELLQGLGCLRVSVLIC